MLTTVEVFDLIKSKHRIESDYALAKRLKTTQSTISLHRKKAYAMDNDLAMRCADLLDIDPAIVFLWTACERAKCTKERDTFARLATWAELRKDELKQIAVPHSEPIRRRLEIA